MMRRGIAVLFFCIAAGALAQPTTITLTAKPLHTGVQRFGINLSGQTYWDSGQLLRNLVSRNPGFEGETWQTILHCKVATASTCIDENPWTVWPANFLANAHYEVLSGAAAGSTGTVLTNSKADSKANLGVALAFTAAKIPLANGDFLLVRLDTIPGDPTAGWWLDKTRGAAISAELHDLSPHTQGKQALRIEAASPDQGASIISYFDSMEGKSFVQLHGLFHLTFRAKPITPGALLTVELMRMTKTGAVMHFNCSCGLKPGWNDYAFEFPIHEPPNSIGTVSLAFKVHGASLLLDDVSLISAPNSSNPTDFRDDVVQTLRDLHPGVLRYMDNGNSFGSSLDNLLAPAFSRQRAGYSTQQTRAEDIPIGIPEFLELCRAVGADPWITLPPGFSPAEATRLIDYLNHWVNIFHTIHLELGNEQWNSGSFPGATINDPNAYAQRAASVFGAMRASKYFQPGKFDLVLGSWFSNPWWSQQELTNSSNADTIAVAPYLFTTFNDARSQEAIFGPMLAQPEQIDSQPNSLMAQQAAAAAAAHKNLAVYETNLGTMSGTATQSDLDSAVPSLGAALAVSTHMLLMLRDLGVTTQNFFALPEFRNDFNNPNGQKETMPLWGAVVDMGGATNRRRPSFLALQMLNNALLPTELTTEVSGPNPTWNQPLSANDKIALDHAHELQTFAFADGAHRSLILLNLSRTQSLPIHLTGPEAPTGAVAQTVLTAAHITDSNEQQDLVEPHSTRYSANESLPPHSLTVLTWSKP